MDLEQSLQIEFSAITGLSNKVFPLVADQGTKAPYLTYELGGAEREKELTGYNGLMEGRYQLDIYHTSYSSLKSLMDLVIAKIKTFNNKTLATTGTYVQQADIINEFESYEEEIKLYHGIIEVNIYYQE